VGDFTILKIDNSRQAFYDVAKVHDTLPRPHVSQDVLGFVRVRAKCVSTSLRLQLFYKKFLTPRELFRKCARSRIAFRRVCSWNDTMTKRIKSQLFSDFSRFPFPEIINEIARVFSRSDSMNLISKMSERLSWKSYFCAFDIMREKNFPRQMLPFHLRLVLPFFFFFSRLLPL